jgi:hypothetical protein
VDVSGNSSQQSVGAMAAPTAYALPAYEVQFNEKQRDTHGSAPTVVDVSCTFPVRPCRATEKCLLLSDSLLRIPVRSINDDCIGWADSCTGKGRLVCGKGSSITTNDFFGAKG